MFSSTVDFHRTRIEGKETADPGPAHSSLTPVERLSRLLSPAPLRGRPPARPRGRFKGASARQIAVQSQATGCCGMGSQVTGITVRHACTERPQQPVLRSPWLFLFFCLYCCLVVGGLDAVRRRCLSRPPRSPARSPPP